MLRHTRWWTLAAAIVVESMGGTAYAFALYSPCIRTRFELTQAQVDFLGTVANWGANFGVHVGALHTTIGPQWTLIFGFIVGVPANLLLWAMLSIFSSWSVPYWAIAFLSFLQGHSQLIVDVVSVSTIVPCFPEHRGRALGIAKSFVGLSGSMIACVYMGIFSPDVVSFTLYITCAFGACTLFGALFMRNPPAGRTIDPEATMPRLRLRGALAWVITLLFVLLVGSMLDLLPKHEAFDLAAVSVAAILFLGLLVYVSQPASDERFDVQLSHADVAVSAEMPIASETRSGDVQPAASIQTAHTEPLGAEGRRERLLPAGSFHEVMEAGADGSSAVENESFNRVDESAKGCAPLAQAVLSKESFLIFWIMVLGPGCGLLIINNLDSLHKAKGGQGDASVLVSLVSTCNCAGRLISGFVSDMALQSGLPRPYCLAGANALMTLAVLNLLFDGIAPVYISAVIGGLAYGSINALFPACVSEIFGLEHLPIMYPTLAMALAFGSWLFATKLYAAVYDAALKRHRGGTVCVGRDCFYTSVLVSAIACIVAVVFSVALGFVTRVRYRQMRPQA